MNDYNATNVETTKMNDYKATNAEMTNMGELIMYKESDLEKCTEIYIAAFTAPPLEYDFLTPAKAERYLRDITRTPGFIGWTYWQSGEMTAFCFGILDGYFDGSMFEVTELAVVPQLHRNGTGSTVMRLLEIKLAGYGVGAVSLHTSRILPAFNFYLKNGYQELTENVTLMKQL